MRTPLLIGLCGYKQSGKDSVAQVLIDELRFERLAFADALKTAALDINPMLIDHTAQGMSYVSLRTLVHVDGGFDQAKQRPEVRRFLQALGTAIRGVDEDVWINGVRKQIENRPDACIVVTDVRFPNEEDLIKRQGGVLIRVVRPGVTADGHISETAVDGMTPDYTIVNDGTLDDLDAKVMRVISEIVLGYAEAISPMSGDWS